MEKMNGDCPYVLGERDKFSWGTLIHRESKIQEAIERRHPLQKLPSLPVSQWDALKIDLRSFCTRKVKSMVRIWWGKFWNEPTTHI